ncbi:hypothetical protein ABKN59_011080 [Abortiporus biennis]
MFVDVDINITEVQPRRVLSFDWSTVVRVNNQPHSTAPLASSRRITCSRIWCVELVFGTDHQAGAVEKISLLLTLRLGFVFYGQGDQQHSQLLPNSHTEYSLFYYTHA